MPETPPYEVYTAKPAVVDSIRSLVRGADEEVALSVPVNEIETFRDVLTDAVDRGVLVLLLVYQTDTTTATAAAVDGLATVVRQCDRPTAVICSVDRQRGVTGHAWMLTGATEDKQATRFENKNLAHAIFGDFLGNYWPMSSELHIVDPDPLPTTYVDFRRAVVQAAIHLREKIVLPARMDVGAVRGEDRDALSGQVVNTRQSMVHPLSNSFPTENSLLVRTDRGQVSVGGEGAYLEDYEATSVTLMESEHDGIA